MKLIEIVAVTSLIWAGTTLGCSEILVAQASVFENLRVEIPLEILAGGEELLVWELRDFNVGKFQCQIALPKRVKQIMGIPLTSPVIPGMVRLGREFAEQFALEQVNFAIDKSEVREWPPHFGDIRRIVAKQYLGRSIYYSTRLDGKLVGTYREIFAPFTARVVTTGLGQSTFWGSEGAIQGAYFFLPTAIPERDPGTGTMLDIPAESIFSVWFPRNPIEVTLDTGTAGPTPFGRWVSEQGFARLLGGFQEKIYEGLLIEPGNLAFDSSVTRQMRLNLVAQFLAVTKRVLRDAKVNPASVTYATYGNSKSERIYAPEGFEVVEEMRNNLNLPPPEFFGLPKSELPLVETRWSGLRTGLPALQSYYHALSSPESGRFSAEQTHQAEAFLQLLQN